MKKAVFVFCTNLERDPVASNVLRSLEQETKLTPTGLIVDEYPVLQANTSTDQVIQIVRTKDVLSHDYGCYAEIFNKEFVDFDLVGLVNWHEGANAPEAIFTVQTTGDMASGTFGPVDPKLTRGLLLAIEEERVSLGLEHFRTFAEATHWSGVQYGYLGTAISKILPSVIDIEIGSTSQDWNNPDAARVLARALLHCFDRGEQKVRSLLCLGGVHFEEAYTRAVLDTAGDSALAVSHILPNQWLVSEGYDQLERLSDLRACVEAISGGIAGIVFHDKLKASYKQLARELADELCVPAFSHKKLKKPDTLPI